MNGATPTRLARVFVELADTQMDDFDLLDFLQVLTLRCVELVPADSAGLLLIDQHGDLQLMASTDERVRRVQLLELRTGNGPALQCYSTGQPVIQADLSAARESWPDFTAAAAWAGFRSTYALPMQLRGHVLGALALFTEREQLGEESLCVGQAMADVATIGLLHERSLVDQRTLSEQLQAALTTRVLIEQAKGMVAARGGITVAEAFARMRRHARTHGITLTALATAVVDGSIDERVLTGT